MKAALGSSRDLNNVIGKVVYDALFARAMRPDFSRDIETFLTESHWLQLPDDVHFQVEDAMNQFESSDFQVGHFNPVFKPG